jgi:hypothetical protein
MSTLVRRPHIAHFAAGQAQPTQFSALSRMILHCVLIPVSQFSRSSITVWPWVSTVFISSLTEWWGMRLHVFFISPLRTHRSSRNEVLKFTARNRPMSRRAQIMTKNPPTIQGISFKTCPFFWVLIPLRNFVRKHRRKPRLCLANDVQTGCCFSIWALFQLCQLHSEVRTCHREPR